MGKSKDQLQPHTWKHLYQKKTTWATKNMTYHTAPSRWLWGSRSESLFSSAWPVELQATSLGVFDEEVGRFSMIANLHVSFHSFPKEWMLSCIIFETHKIIKSMLVDMVPRLENFRFKQLQIRWFLLVISTVQLPRQPKPTSPFMDAFGSFLHPAGHAFLPEGSFQELKCRKWSNLMIIFFGSVQPPTKWAVSHHV